MRNLTLYRGIAVAEKEAARVVASIWKNGMPGSKGTWKFMIPNIVDVRARLEKLFSKADLTDDDIFSITPFRGLCACGTPSGAAYYALCHNFSAYRNNHAIAIEFTADMDEVYVDPRDFLCTAFQLWDRKSERNRERQMDVLCQLFGPAIKRYFAAACQSKDQRYRIGICNLAVFDREVISGHISNDSVIAGRNGTRFCSAFFVKAPVSAAQVKRVYTPTMGKVPTNTISLEDFLKGA